MRKHHILSTASIVALSVGALWPCSAPLASGLSLEESTAVEIGNAHAGQALADDASTIVWNPAGLTRLHGVNFTANLSAISYAPKFTNSGSTTAIGTPLSGGDGGNAGGLTLLPSVFFSAELAPNWTAGVGVYTPFGLKTEYDQGWVGRYQAIKSDFETININPSVAWKATEHFSFGGGIDIMNASADTTRNVDFGAICFNSPFGPANCAAAGLTPGNAAHDGNVEVKGSSWGVGFNLGAMYAPTAGTRFGLTYRSAIRENIQGAATFANPPLPGPFALLAATPATTSSNASTTIWLPESATANFVTALNEQWSILGNVNWTRWSRLNELRVKFATGAPDSATTFFWRDTWNFSLAANYQVTSALKLRAGLEYETDASRDGYRNPLVPESKRRLIAVGFNYRFTPKDSVDFGYSHVFFSDFNISSKGSFGDTLNGSYKVSADLFGLQYNRNF